MDKSYEMEPKSTVYGPVRSWRVGMSLGIDLLLVNSICSFRCIYCQLGRINIHTGERQVFVPTEKIISDLMAAEWQAADVITLSGSGEPTLAANLGEVIHEIKVFTGKPLVVLTNSAHLNDPQVRRELLEADKIFCKLDAADDDTLKLIDRPVEGVTVRTIVDGIKALRKEYSGYLAIQTMLMPLNSGQIGGLAGLLNEIKPDEVQLNTPLRAVPREWITQSRGDHGERNYPTVRLKVIDRQEAERIEAELRRLTGLPIISVYDKQPGG